MVTKTFVSWVKKEALYKNVLLISGYDIYFLPPDSVVQYNVL
jgi:hypothetical protein